MRKDEIEDVVKRHEGLNVGGESFEKKPVLDVILSTEAGGPGGFYTDLKNSRRCSVSGARKKAQKPSA